MRVDLMVTGALLFLSACSETPPPTKIADVGEIATGAAFYLYRPGGTLEDYITLEIKRGETRRTVLYIGRCFLAAAKVGDGVIDTALFGSEFSVKSNIVSTGRVITERSLLTVIRSVEVAPTDSEMMKLKQDGFTMITCNFA